MRNFVISCNDHCYACLRNSFFSVFLIYFVFSVCGWVYRCVCWFIVIAGELKVTVCACESLCPCVFCVYWIAQPLNIRQKLNNIVDAAVRLNWWVADLYLFPFPSWNFFHNLDFFCRTKFLSFLQVICVSVKIWHVSSIDSHDKKMFF